MSDQNNLFDEIIDASPNEVLANMDSPEIREQWPQLLTECVDAVAARFNELKLDDDQSRYYAIEAVSAIGKLCSGSNIYWPKFDRVERVLRDKQIWSEFNGYNVDQLIRKYKLSEMQVYNILRDQRAIHLKRKQPDLFTDTKD